MSILKEIHIRVQHWISERCKKAGNHLDNPSGWSSWNYLCNIKKTVKSALFLYTNNNTKKTVLIDPAPDILAYFLVTVYDKYMNEMKFVLPITCTRKV